MRTLLFLCIIFIIYLYQKNSQIRQIVREQSDTIQYLRKELKESEELVSLYRE